MTTNRGFLTKTPHLVIPQIDPSLIFRVNLDHKRQVVHVNEPLTRSLRRGTISTQFKASRAGWTPSGCSLALRDVPKPAGIGTLSGWLQAIRAVTPTHENTGVRNEGLSMSRGPQGGPPPVGKVSHSWRLTALRESRGSLLPRYTERFKID